MTFWQNKSVLVAGGAGFIGHHLVRALLKAKASVHVVDDYSTGQLERLHSLKAVNANQLTIQCQDISQKCVLPPVDVIYNLASPASPLHYQSDPIQTWKTNVLGTLHLLDHMISCDATFIQASTSEVYGDPLSHPQKETDWGNVNPVGPRACYDESKRAAEALLMDAVRVSNADVRIARIFNTYGPGMSIQDGRAIPNFVAQVQSGEPLTIHGDGSQTRSFCYISDTVEGLLRLGSVSAARGKIFNIGNPAEMTVKELATQVNATFHGTSSIELHPRPVDDPTRRCPDITKAKDLLSWEPVVTLQEGLQRLFDVHQRPLETA